MRAGWSLAWGGAACLLLAWRPGPARLMWNATASVSVGLYRLSPADHLVVGDLVVVAPPPATAAFLARRGWLPLGVPLLKPIAARQGQRVCRTGGQVRIDGQLVARARIHDRQGRALPGWNGCRRLGAQDVFLLNAAAPDSFDGRYFGVSSRTAVLARATPIWLPTPPSPHGERP